MSEVPAPLGLQSLDWLAIAAAVLCLALLTADLIRHGPAWTPGGE